MKNNRILIASALVAMTCGLASASSLTGTCTTAGPGPTELGTATPGTISCTQFSLNPSYLTSVVITLTGDVVSPSTLTLTNNNASPATGSASTDVAYNLGTALSGFTFTTDAFGNLFDVIAGTGTKTLAGNSSTGAIPITGTASNTATDTTSFGAYEGAGSFTISGITATSLISAFGGGNVSVTQVTDADLKATVTYNYTIPSGTPEPATMVLFGSALVGLGLIRRRARQS